MRHGNEEGIERAGESGGGSFNALYAPKAMPGEIGAERVDVERRMRAAQLDNNKLKKERRRRGEEAGGRALF
jgi:hypothetical protein